MKTLLKISILLTLTITLSLCENKTFSPSFDCSNKTKLSEAEKLICSDKKLLNYQKETEKQYSLVSAIYLNANGRIYSSDKDVSDIYQFLQQKRDKCETKKCLLNFYKTNNFFIGAIEWSINAINDKFDYKQVNGNYAIRPHHEDEEVIRNGENLCNNLFNDLSNNFNNITIIQPIVQMVSYDDERLKKALGSCYKARMDLDKRLYPRNGYILFSLWSVDIDKDNKDELIFVQFGAFEETRWHFLDKERCKIALNNPDFNSNKDEVSVKIDFTRSYNIPVTPPMLISYDNEIRLFNMVNTHINFIQVHTFYKDFKTKPKRFFPEGTYHEGSYELFGNTCDISFTNYKQTKE